MSTNLLNKTLTFIAILIAIIATPVMPQTVTNNFTVSLFSFIGNSSIVVNNVANTNFIRN